MEPPASPPATMASPFNAWRALSVRGSCGDTREGVKGDCLRGKSGSTAIGSTSLASAVGSCLQFCAQCARCRYISVSTRYNDCSWYSACQLRRLKATSATKTFLSGPAAPPWNATPTVRRLRRAKNVTSCPVARAPSRAQSWDPSEPPPSTPRRRPPARIALLQASDKPMVKPASLDEAAAALNATWRARTPPCFAPQLNFLAAAANRAYASRHGYDYVEARGGCAQQLGRHPAWCKLVMVKGLLWDATVARPYEWVVSLDSDAAFNAPGTSVEAWFAAGAAGAAAAHDLPLSQLADDRCAASHHGAGRLERGCVVMGKDLGGVSGVNSGVAFVRRSASALRLLGAWWSWPDSSPSMAKVPSSAGQSSPSPPPHLAIFGFGLL